METKEIEQLLKQELGLDEVYVRGENAHFDVIAVSDKFADLSRVKQQQLIYAPLMEHLASNAIHALTIKTFTVEKWNREKLFFNL
ncbi:BolA family protein [Gallibacterium sp. AGMB14963]|uniref:BolA family protein n=1 Tax=Gallibacterium faecale TaxID=3019086 RepID=UPI0022F1A96E|nr:BolA family protein [Gallibacterium sp. AGMB14963]MDA3978696.1 BolA family transcriptional regulator [Gallibacterium sp. AGMB14963]